MRKNQYLSYDRHQYNKWKRITKEERTKHKERGIYSLAKTTSKRKERGSSGGQMEKTKESTSSTSPSQAILKYMFYYQMRQSIQE